MNKLLGMILGFIFAVPCIFLGIILYAQIACAVNQSMEKDMQDSREIYFAGGCFWGVEEYFSRIPGVIDTTAGYAQSLVPEPDYRQVCDGKTGAAETVRVVFNPAKVSLATLVKQFFKIIDPLAVNRQGNDIGTQYRTGIYFSDPAMQAPLSELMEQESEKYGKKLATTLEPLRNFYPAEDYHQDYLKKNPGGYCHINFDSLAELENSPDSQPKDAELRARLSPEEYHVTQENGTEAPFTGKYWNQKKPGIYVDVVSGDPLFVSTDKFDSGTGWPSFTKPVNEDALTQKLDLGHGMRRVEVRSKKANSHLGHVFGDGPNGMPRYCINSAALRFIPLEDMAKEGYGDYIKLVKE